MIKLRLTAGVHPGDWRLRGHRWESGEDWIEPFAHTALESALVTDGTATFAMVRERRRGGGTQCPVGSQVIQASQHTYRDALREIQDWPFDYVLIEIADRQAVRLSAGVWGSAPVYLTTAGRVLYGSWDPTDLVQHLSRPQLVPGEVARFLTYWRRYSHKTIIDGVHRLTERMTVDFDDAGLRMRYPADAKHSRPRALRDGTDPVGEFERLLKDSIHLRGFDPATAAAELSGGMDSANVAMTLAAEYPGLVTSTAMMLIGDSGRQQARRRRQLIDFAGFAADIRVAASSWLPLAPSSPRRNGVRYWPDEEPFSEAAAAMFAGLHRRGISVVFGGVGGDELMALREWERDHPLDRDARLFPPWVTPQTINALTSDDGDIAPASVLAEVTLLAFACSAPLYLRAGLWPISPLATPGLIRFSEWLPHEWRAGKRLLRERLSRLGLSALVVYPPIRETFTDVMTLALRRHGLPLLATMLSDSVLVDQGYVDREVLASWCTRAEHDPAPVDRRVYPVVALECALRSLFGARRPG